MLVWQHQLRVLLQRRRSLIAHPETRGIQFVEVVNVLLLHRNSVFISTNRQAGLDSLRIRAGVFSSSFYVPVVPIVPVFLIALVLVRLHLLIRFRSHERFVSLEDRIVRLSLGRYQLRPVMAT